MRRTGYEHTNSYEQRRRRLAKKRRSRGGIIIAVTVATAFAVVIYTRISAADKRIRALDSQIEALNEQIEEEEEKKLELVEKKDYVQTDEYMEEVAKKLGLLYPDEILYKPSN